MEGVLVLILETVAPVEMKIIPVASESWKKPDWSQEGQQGLSHPFQ